MGDKVKNIFKEGGFDMDINTIDDCFRIGCPVPKRPILVKFATILTKEEALTYKTTLASQGYRVTHDYTIDERRAYREVVPSNLNLLNILV